MTIRAATVLAALIGLVLVYATDQIVPAGTDRQAQLRLWLAARSAGIVAYLLLTFQVTLGLVLSHPTNKSTWKLSKVLFLARPAVGLHRRVRRHASSIVLDPYAGVGVTGAFIGTLRVPQRTSRARHARPLRLPRRNAHRPLYTVAPRGMWLVLHRLALVVFALGWAHGVLAGSDSGALEPLYISTGLVVLLAAVYRYWIIRQRRSATGLHSEVASR